MRKIARMAFGAAVIVSIILCSSCQGSKEKPVNSQSDKEIYMVVEGKDTTAVLNLMNTYFDLLKKKDFEGAISMMKEYDVKEHTLRDVSEEIKKHYLMSLKAFSPIDYQVEQLVFLAETDCKVKYSAILFEKENDEDNRPNKMFFAVKPVRIEGQWYLTVADRDDDNTKLSDIKI